MNPFSVFTPLNNSRFARLYSAQTISQLGDAFTWVALALLAYDLAGVNAAIILGISLTLRVTAFVLLSPLAGVLADRLERKTILLSCHFGRAIIVGLMAVVTSVWQVYILIFLLNALTAFFTPTNQATIPLIVGRDNAGKSFALASATTELLGIVGPGMAGFLATFLGGRSLFYFDALSFLLAGLLMLTLPSLKAQQESSATSHWKDVRDGSARLWQDAPIRFALLMELIAAVTGALILVVSVLRVKDGLNLGDIEFGWVMALYGLGATLASLVVASLGKKTALTRFIFVGAVLTSVAIVPADVVGFSPLLFLWLLAGIGQNWVNLPTETLLAERTEESAQGRVYGAHFAWSHLWWAFAYPLASFLSTRFTNHTFLYGGIIALLMLALSYFLFSPRQHQLK